MFLNCADPTGVDLQAQGSAEGVVCEGEADQPEGTEDPKLWWE